MCTNIRPKLTVGQILAYFSYLSVVFVAAAAAAAKSLQSCPTLCDPIDGSPWGSPIPGILRARTLEWVAISFSNAGKWKVRVKSLSCPTLRDPMDCSQPGSSIHGIVQARVLEWGAIAFSSICWVAHTKPGISHSFLPSFYSSSLHPSLPNFNLSLFFSFKSLQLQRWILSLCLKWKLRKISWPPSHGQSQI